MVHAIIHSATRVIITTTSDDAPAVGKSFEAVAFAGKPDLADGPFVLGPGGQLSLADQPVCALAFDKTEFKDEFMTRIANRASRS